MAIIMRKSGQKREDGNDKKKQLYTWSGCGLVIILTLVMVLPNAGSKPQPDYSKFSSSKMQDLAALPFGSDDEAADFLRANPDYKDVSNAELLGSLFSPEDRKARHERDELKGTPPPPDPEYQEIYEKKLKDEEAKGIVKERRERRTRETAEYKKAKEARAEKIKQKKEARLAAARKSKEQSPTKVSTLSKGSGLSSQGASSAVVGTTWGYSDKNTKGTPGATNTGNNHEITAKDLAFAKNKGRDTGFYQAVVESRKGANADTAEGRMAGAMKAFDGSVEVGSKELASDEDLALEGDEDITDLIDTDAMKDLTNAINDDVNKQASKEQEKAKDNSNELNANCMDRKGKWNKTCFWSTFWMELAKSSINGLVNCATSGCWNNWKSSGDWTTGTDENGHVFLYNKKTGDQKP